MRRSVAAVPEEVVRLNVNGRHVATWSCSPAALDALGAGRLLALGYIRTGDDLLSVGAPRRAGMLTIEADILPDAEAAGREEDEHRRRHGCGLRYLIDCRPDRLPARAAGAAGVGGGTGPVAAGGAQALETEPFAELFRELFDRSPSRKDGGGHHTAAVTDGARLFHVFEEVGRHNGADKAIGAAFLDGSDLRTLGLLTTARISGEMAEKAARAGLAWVASRSVPTTLAVDLAAAAGVPLVARAASPDARVFMPGDPGTRAAPATS